MPIYAPKKDEEVSLKSKKTFKILITKDDQKYETRDGKMIATRKETIDEI